MWMNEHDVEECVALLHEFEQRSGAEYPNLIAGAETLQRLVRWTNRNSDGWPYWKLPSQAASKLQDKLSNVRREYIDGKLEDLTEGELKALYRPIKAFLTRQGANHEDVGFQRATPPPPPPTYQNPEAINRIEGTITCVDGEQIRFSIDPTTGWKKWGNADQVLYRAGDLVEALNGVAFEHLQEPEEEA